jgi:hypothetical protein
MDWVKLFEENGIPYVTRGPNTAKGNVSIKCPFCGDSDPSMHMGVSLTSESWGCLRDAEHRGRSPKWLVRALLGCSFTQAGLVVNQYSHSDPDDLDGVIQMLQETKVEEETAPVIVKFPSCFKPIKPRGTTKRFFTYLEDRGLDAKRISKDYDLRCSHLGQYKDRIIIPIYNNGQLQGWTSRALGNPVNAPRYLASSNQIKTTIWNFDELKKGGDRLFVVEGPFDAIRIDSFAKAMRPLGIITPSLNRAWNVKATCTFGTSVTLPQIILLKNIAKNFKEVYVMFDRGAEAPSAELASWLQVKEVRLPDYAKDPGELGAYDLDQLCHPRFSGLLFGTEQYNAAYRRYHKTKYTI